MPRATVKKNEEEVPEQETVQPDPEPEAVSDSGDDYDSYAMDPNEELWEGGPNFAQINEWKDKFGDIYVTSVTPEKHLVWRTLTRFEYRRLVKNLEQAVASGQVSQVEANMNNEETIAEMVVLYPGYHRTDAIKEMAGVASTIAQQCMEASGFVSMEVRQL